MSSPAYPASNLLSQIDNHVEPSATRGRSPLAKDGLGILPLLRGPRVASSRLDEQVDSPHRVPHHRVVFKEAIEPLVVTPIPLSEWLLISKALDATTHDGKLRCFSNSRYCSSSRLEMPHHRHPYAQ